MITHGDLDARSASSPAEIRTSVMAGLSCSVVGGRVDPKSFCKAHIQNSGFLQHLAKLLGCRRYDGDEVGLAKPALGAMALQVTARGTMQHRCVRGSDRGLADLQPKLDN